MERGNGNDVRWDRVRDARRKIAEGYYDDPKVLEETVERVQRQLTLQEILEAGGSTAYGIDPEDGE